MKTKKKKIGHSYDKLKYNNILNRSHTLQTLKNYLRSTLFIINFTDWLYYIIETD